MIDKLNYWRRIFRVYFTKNKGYLAFWHEQPGVNENINLQAIGPYYMTFKDKSNYTGPKDKTGVILFDYHFEIGRQYNPLAIAQYGLGHYNLYLKTGGREHFEIAKTQADWLVKNLEDNNFGIPVWKHHFRWHYKNYLESGWYSAHSQGSGISLLARIYKETNDKKYLETAEKAFLSLDLTIDKGGVKFIDEKGNVWLEEYLTQPPAHILNGFLWALWGAWDYYLLTNNERALKLWNDCLKTLKKNLSLYDAKFWSLYDMSCQTMKMLASPFYHQLHIVQLKVMYILTKESIFDFYVKKFESYQKKWLNKKMALIYKVIFKFFYF